MTDVRKPPSQEFDDEGAFRLTRHRDVAALEDEVSENGEDIRSIKELLQKREDSYEGFKRSYFEDRKADAIWRVDMSRDLGKMAGAAENTNFWVKVMAGFAAAALAALVALVALAVRR